MCVNNFEVKWCNDDFIHSEHYSSTTSAKISTAYICNDLWGAHIGFKGQFIISAKRYIMYVIVFEVGNYYFLHINEMYIEIGSMRSEYIVQGPCI